MPEQFARRTGRGAMLRTCLYTYFTHIKCLHLNVRCQSYRYSGCLFTFMDEQSKGRSQQFIACSSIFSRAYLRLKLGEGEISCTSREKHFYGCDFAFYRVNLVLDGVPLQCIPLNGRTMLETNRFIYHNKSKKYENRARLAGR